jgi:hypothetical protein
MLHATTPQPLQITPALQETCLWALCMTRHGFRNAIPVRYERVLQWQQNRSKVTVWLPYKNSRYSRVPKTLLLHWRLYVACYYPITPTDYPSTTWGMCVGPPVAVNIGFCEYLWFFNISFVWIIWVQYATDNLSGQERVFRFIGQCWYFNPQWNPEQAIFNTQSNETLFRNWQKESWQTFEETSGYVRQERVNNWPNSMTGIWWWWWWRWWWDIQSTQCQNRIIRGSQLGRTCSY